MRPSTKRIIEEHAAALEKIARDNREFQAKFAAQREAEEKKEGGK
jgi:hypothetical protein